MVRVRAGSATDVGRHRQVNEDSAFTSAGVFAVADGMGGHSAGAVASAMVVAWLDRLAALPDLKPDDVRDGLATANRDILASASAHPERAGMGTTIAGLSLIRFAGSEHWLVFNVGDSRVYRFADGDLTQLTNDHSEVAEMVSAGTITGEDARTHRRRNVVTRALGSDPGPEPDVWVFPPVPGERFVICSDGLTNELPDREISGVLHSQPVAQHAADCLVRRAVEAGGRDNVTVVVVDHMVEDDRPDEDTVPRPAWSHRAEPTP